MRHISFALTTPQVRARTKTVTRRTTWKDLQPGTLLQAVEKSQGLKKGERVNKLAVIRVVSVRREPLSRLETDTAYGFAETTREGFPEGNDLHWPSAFVAFFVASHKNCTSSSEVTRIEFEYVDAAK